MYHDNTFNFDMYMNSNIINYYLHRRDDNGRLKSPMTRRPHHCNVDYSMRINYTYIQSYNRPRKLK